MDVAKIKASGDAALAQISNALDDLEYSPDQRPVPLLRLAMDYVRDIIAELGQEVGAVALIEAARDWIAKAPHGDNCYLDPDHAYGNSCYCGKESILSVLESPAHTSEARDAEFVRGVNAERREDMSPTGRLRLNAEEDGDMVVTVIDERGSIATVEFCNSGGKSPRTLDALRHLSVAMTEDAAMRQEGGNG